MSAAADLLRPVVVGSVRAGESLARHTTLKVGGPAAAYVVAEAAGDLAVVADVCAEQEAPWLILGRGSNLLVADNGWPGVVVVLGRAFRGVAPVGERVALGAAEPMPVLARQLELLGLGGMAFGVAIPGTVGGAVRMNAGAHGGQMADVLEWAEVARLGAGGATEHWSAGDLAMTYRHTALPPDAVVVRAGVRLRPADRPALAAEMNEMRRWRRATQPINTPSCGSVFRNPPGDSAGRLIEAAGMKGHRVGGACISEVHANFITTAPGATATDVHTLLRHAQARVSETHGIQLVPEVVIAGFDDATAEPGLP